MKILVLTNPKSKRLEVMSCEFDRIIITEKIAEDQELLEYLQTRLNRQNPEAQLIIATTTII